MFTIKIGLDGIGLAVIVEPAVRCYPKARRCYFTEWKKHNVSDAEQYCKANVGMSLPTLADRASLLAFYNYMLDAVKVQKFGNVWLGARADTQDISTANYQWISGVDTSNDMTVLRFTTAAH